MPKNICQKPLGLQKQIKTEVALQMEGIRILGVFICLLIAFSCAIQLIAKHIYTNKINAFNRLCFI